MTVRVALLRAINVGGHTVKMDELRRLFGELHLADVATFIASGNVVFSDDRPAGELESIIEPHLESALGYTVETFVRSIDELAAIATADVFGDVQGKPGTSMYVSFLKAAGDAAMVQRLAALETPADRFVVNGSEFYWWRDGKMTDSPIKPSQLNRAVGVPTTSRNITSVQKLVAKFG